MFADQLRGTQVLPIALGAAALTGILTAAPASATLTLERESGGTIITIEDDLAGDTLLGDGQISFSGTVGDLDTTITVGVSNSPGDSVNDAFLSLTSVAVESLGPAATSLIIRLTDSDFVLPDVGSAGALISDISLSQIGDAVDSANFTSFADPGNGLFAETVAAPILVLGDNGGTTSSTAFTSPGAFSLTSELEILLAGPGVVTLTGNTTVVPEPASIGLLALGGMFLAAGRRRRS